MCMHVVVDDHVNVQNRSLLHRDRGAPLETVKVKEINSGKEKWQQKPELLVPWHFSS